MTTSRKIGASDSTTRALLVDAAEQLMLEEGYAAVTSRRVGVEAGVRSNLVHYYFATMDDLFLEVYRRRAQEGLDRCAEALANDRSLRSIWNLSNAAGTAFSIEFVVLANHRKAIRAEIALYAKRFRAMQLEAISEILADHGITRDRCPPVVLMLAMTGITQVMALEETLGVTAGHDDTLAFIERFIDDFERQPLRTGGDRP